MTRVSDLFSPDDLAAVEAAIGVVEQTTSGEIVAVIAGESDGYRGAAWKAGLLGALAASLGAALWMWAGNPWDLWLEAWMVGPPAAGAALGFLAVATSSRLRRLLIDDSSMDERVECRAAEAFLAEEVFDTRERTGLLLFASLFERRLVVLADREIRAAVPPDDWETIVRRFTAAMRCGEVRAAFLEAVDACGEILRRHGVEGRGDDRDELSDRPRVEESE